MKTIYLALATFLICSHAGAIVSDGCGPQLSAPETETVIAAFTRRVFDSKKVDKAGYRSRSRAIRSYALRFESGGSHFLALIIGRDLTTNMINPPRVQFFKSSGAVMLLGDAFNWEDERIVGPRVLTIDANDPRYEDLYFNVLCQIEGLSGTLAGSMALDTNFMSWVNKRKRSEIISFY